MELKKKSVSIQHGVAVAFFSHLKKCALCAKERLEILKQSRSNPQLLINSNNEIYGTCRHRPRFHRCAKQATPSADESVSDERASPTHKVTTDFARCNVCLVDV